MPGAPRGRPACPGKIGGKGGRAGPPQPQLSPARRPGRHPKEVPGIPQQGGGGEGPGLAPRGQTTCPSRFKKILGPAPGPCRPPLPGTEPLNPSFGSPGIKFKPRDLDIAGLPISDDTVVCSAGKTRPTAAAGVSPAFFSPPKWSQPRGPPGDIGKRGAHAGIGRLVAGRAVAAIVDDQQDEVRDLVVGGFSPFGVPKGSLKPSPSRRWRYLFRLRHGEAKPKRGGKPPSCQACRSSSAGRPEDASPGLAGRYSLPPARRRSAGSGFSVRRCGSWSQYPFQKLASISTATGLRAM
ncbi:MAG: hypothetical protein CM15mP60_2260 [Alphaproteobacteria bacterium]|nr:MAG: hypothetical protein CM15mP60_2260 [Alphaproteobacteria bacterium]